MAEIRELLNEIGPSTAAVEVLALLEHPDAEEAHVLALLRKRSLATSTVEAISKHERWNQYYRVKAAIVNHPKAPKTLSLRLLNLLYWQELLRVTSNFRLAMPIRVAAENHLVERLGQLELGEKISLARSAPLRVMKLLAKEGHPRVVEALLTNPRLSETEVMVLAENPKTETEVLRTMARSERWVSRYPVKLAVVKHPRTPVHEALKLLASLPRTTVSKLLASGQLPRVVHLGAERMLD